MQRPEPPVEGTSLYLAQILGNPVVDAGGAEIGTVRDLVARFGSEPRPPIIGVVVRQRRREFFVERSQVEAISVKVVRLASYRVNLRPFERRPGEMLLRRDILDKQLIDVDGRRVVRANDLEIGHRDGDYRLVGVDVSAQALVRRLGPEALTHNVRGHSLIDWEHVDSFAIDVPMVRLKLRHEGLKRLHPVDVAHLLDELPAQHLQEVVEAVDEATAADIVQELEPDDAADLMSSLDPERAADILDEMDPDDAADLLGDLPPEQAEDLLDRMEPEESADVRELISYEPDTAGGLMTTDFVTLPAGTPAGRAIEHLRSLEEPPDPLYHVYLVEEEGSRRLAGVAPLRDVLLAGPEVPLADLGWRQVQTVRATDSARDVVHIMAEYNLAALPVVDDEGDLVGVVSVDDAMDILLPDLWSRRISKARR
jgi:CBS domain-containing protein/sporulation protein YlmC with PRC-barrel domain